MEEDLMHAVIKCSHAQRFWNEAITCLDVRLPRLHPHTWAQDILCDPRFLDEDRAKIITIMWSIWHSRNKWKHEGEAIDPRFSIKLTRVALALLDFSKKQIILPGHGWRPPDEGFVVVNTNGAIN
jgi:hypothetical protein